MDQPQAMSASAGKKRGRKAGSKKDGETTPKKKKGLDSRFGGKTEEEIMQLFLPDHLKADLDVVFIGINPGLLSAHLGHHYCNANNHFWPCMYESGLIPRKLTYKEDAECLDYGIGFTNIVPRTTRSSNDLTRKEIKEWSLVMTERMKELRPLVACFNGKGIYEIFTGKKCEVGVQTERLPGTDVVVYVMPSTSGRAASHPRRVDKLKFFYELKELRDRLKLQQGRTSTKDAVYSQLGSPKEQPPVSDHLPENQPSSVSVTSSLKNQSPLTDPSRLISSSVSKALTVSTTIGKASVGTDTASIAPSVSSTALTADKNAGIVNSQSQPIMAPAKMPVIYSTTSYPGVATPPLYIPANTSTSVVTGAKHPQTMTSSMPHYSPMPGGQITFIPPFSQGLQMVPTSVPSSLPTAPKMPFLGIHAGVPQASAGHPGGEGINPLPFSQGLQIVPTSVPSSLSVVPTSFSGAFTGLP